MVKESNPEPEDFWPPTNSASGKDLTNEETIIPVASDLAFQDTNTSSSISCNSLSALTGRWPGPLNPKALHGLAGQVVLTIGPKTEADQVALLIQFLIAFGNVIGRAAHFTVEGEEHYCNTFCVLIGKTSKGRKGTSWSHVRNLYKATSPDWAANRIVSGLSTGEGLIYHVRDPLNDKDPGISDKRLLAIGAEFASILKVGKREGNTLSPVIRESWDTGQLRTLTKNKPMHSTGAHISIIGHIAKEELKRHLSHTEIANGFANRFLWVCVDRSQVLPNGGHIAPKDIEPLVIQLKRAIERAQGVGELKRDVDADELWVKVYPDLSEGKPGLFGALVGRAEAQIMRLAVIYALLDFSNVVRHEHLAAALALYDYVEASVRYVFGNNTGNWIADRILDALLSLKDGLTRTQISDGLFKHNQSSQQINRALNLLKEFKLVKPIEIKNGKYSTERWVALADYTNYTNK